MTLATGNANRACLRPASPVLHVSSSSRKRALIVSGSETDVCVLATVLGAVDIGYRVIVVRDALCSSSDEGHDMLMRLYHTRFSEQIETADAEAILSRWQ